MSRPLPRSLPAIVSQPLRRGVGRRGRQVGERRGGPPRQHAVGQHAAQVCGRLADPGGHRLDRARLLGGCDVAGAVAVEIAGGRHPVHEIERAVGHRLPRPAGAELQQRLRQGPFAVEIGRLAAGGLHDRHGGTAVAVGTDDVEVDQPEIGRCQLGDHVDAEGIEVFQQPAGLGIGDAGEVEHVPWSIARKPMQLPSR